MQKYNKIIKMLMTPGGGDDLLAVVLKLFRDLLLALSAVW